ncbi:MAG: type II secretion system F family protein [gamma proteobacterium symbiont of Bathyaustriella thionipta]|nr:type II secretion system F family protein [gamma proteobacterium symbiont of Bathyaustriella thionipta]MCU7950835.1 type II secretion system F family protein [gamma proteobacterium symbiont of Bathyaustriella thionipta]MCU7952289.1 type II secretion system F family protein [gamma proteobacterium symbiont of Bathyaustriella thionipta]MCU7957357.1 type II secretion system F family protein [gamma proteobacterium symbiont of Bathyaustriella thionipta]MCU7966734.1 type II secretion system F famil
MARYFYKGRTSRGEAVENTVEASSEDALSSQLFNSGITPIEISPAAKINETVSFKRRLGFGKPKTEELILFAKQMATLFKAGIPITRAMNGLAQTTHNEYLREILEHSIRQLESGQPLSSGLAKYPEVFPNVFLSVMKVGESTGRLDDAFAQLSFYLERDKMIKDKIKEATRYPSFVLIFLAVAFTALNIFVIPKFAGVFAKMNLDLPIYTKMLLATSDMFVNYWPWMLATVAALILGFRQYVSTDAGRFNFDKGKFKIPYIGGIIRKAILARFCRAFALTQRSGVPLVQALTLVANAVGNNFVADRVTSMRSGVERGDNLTNTATATGLFTPLVLQMIAVGEETGQVDEMLVKVAEFYEEEV